MELFKRADRGLRAGDMLKGFRECGYTIKGVGEWSKWLDLRCGGRLQDTITVYEVKNKNMRAYLLKDSLQMVAAALQPDKNEVLTFLKENGYKPIKQWYIEDCGMTEETWNEWNGIGNDEEE